MIRYEKAGLRFQNGAFAYREIDFEIEAGCFCVLLGPSGAGKSSLLRAANGLSPASEGAVRVAGLEVTRRNLRAVRRMAATIHQHAALSERLSAIDNVLAGAAERTALWRILMRLYPEAARARAARLLADVGISAEDWRRRAGALSGGEQQRIGIARALMGEPCVILADEPVASLDPETARSVMAILKGASVERGASVLCSLHQVDLARAFADRVIGLKAGRIVFDGPPGELDARTVSTIYGVGDAATAAARGRSAA